MSDMVQHILVLSLVAFCVAWVLRGVIKTIRQKQGGLGKCCEKGCATQTPSAPRIVFMPAEMLTRKRS